MQPFQFSTSDKLFFIYPHPDDETIFNAGLFQYLNKSKINYKVLILTKGEASTLKRKLGKIDLKTKRQLEFYNSMKVLNVKYYEIADFEDGGLSRARKLPEFLSEKIKVYKPSYIITFEPNGLYGHTDHVFLSHLLTDIAKSENIKIIYTTIPNTYKLDNGALKMSVLSPLPKHLEASFILKLSIGELINKIRSYYAYRSQFSFKKELVLRPFNFFEIRKEYYTLKEDK